MSQFSASYSSLEEAWGESSIAPKKNKKIPKKSVTFKDPVCQLYENAGSPSNAYTENDILEYVNSTTAGPATYSRAKFAKSQPVTRDVYNQYVAINAPPPVGLQPSNMDPNESLPQWSDPVSSQWTDPGVLQSVEDPKQTQWVDPSIMQEVPRQQVETPSAPPEDDAPSAPPASLESQEEAPPPPIRASKQEEDNDVIEFLSYMEKNAQSSSTNTKDIMVFADIGLYILSGIILIFMMEQFVKIGLSMRG